MVQGAVYDAVNSIDGGHRAYLSGLPTAPSTASKDAAVATAAHHVLVGLVPALPQPIRDRLDGLHSTFLGGIANGPRKDAGIAAGAAAAAAMLADRVGDGRYVPLALIPGTKPGQWRPDPPAFASDPFAWVSKVRPFTLRSTSQFRSDGPDALTSRAYAKDFNEVKELGSAASTERTAEQTAIGLFYTENVSTLFNRTYRAIAQDRGLTLVESARLFAMLDLAAADAAINCWDEKVYWAFSSGHRNPSRGHGPQPEDGGRSQLVAPGAHAAIFGPLVRLQLPHRGVREHRQGVPRHQQDHLHRP